MSSQARTEYKRSGSTQRNLVGPVSADAERATADSLAWPRLLLSTQWPPTDIRLSPCVLLHARMPLALAEFEPSSMLITPSSAVPLLHADIGATSPPPSTGGLWRALGCTSTAAAESAEASEDGCFICGRGRRGGGGRLAISLWRVPMRNADCDEREGAPDGVEQQYRTGVTQVDE